MRKFRFGRVSVDVDVDIDDILLGIEVDELQAYINERLGFSSNTIFNVLESILDALNRGDVSGAILEIERTLHPVFKSPVDCAKKLAAVKTK